MGHSTGEDLTEGRFLGLKFTMTGILSPQFSDAFILELSETLPSSCSNGES